jgi:hypothetical protein
MHAPCCVWFQASDTVEALVVRYGVLAANVDVGAVVQHALRCVCVCVFVCVCVCVCMYGCRMM